MCVFNPINLTTNDLTYCKEVPKPNDIIVRKYLVRREVCAI